jgi:hypothetical protein
MRLYGREPIDQKLDYYLAANIFVNDPLETSKDTARCSPKGACIPDLDCHPLTLKGVVLNCVRKQLN